ncbi:MAG: DUF4384 domain-containing protein [Alphaproteobacteria bacterium]|nr:DUF4384 domain-containing protein [Alphaproteobacteria bacterium]
MSASNKWLFLTACAVAILGSLFGCGGTLPDPQKASVAVQPTNAPVRNITSFSEALRCMDHLFLTYNKSGFVITSTGIPDSTGKMSVGARDMLITAISRMSKSSDAFHYVDFELNAGQVDTVQHLSSLMLNSGQMKIDAPQVYIRGSISQVDQAIQSGKEGFGLTTGYLDFGAQKDRMTSQVTLELHLGNFMTRTLISGIDANNTITIVRSGQGLDAGAKISKAGLNFSVSSDTSEGSGQAVRTLVELGVIELMGKWTQVPYWTCLEIERTNPMAMKQLRDWYDGMSEKEQIQFVQAGLIGSGHYQGKSDGMQSEALRSAISRYQADRGLVPTGRISFEVYESMMAGNMQFSALPASAPPKPPQITPTPIAVNLLGDKREYSVGDAALLSLSLSRSGFAYCYYKDADGTVVQIYPNRFQPDKLVQAGRSLSIPDSSVPGNFSIRLTRKGAKEDFACLASDIDIGTLLPPKLRVQELTPIDAKNLDDVVKMVQGVVPQGTLGSGRYTVNVR